MARRFMGGTPMLRKRPGRHCIPAAPAADGCDYILLRGGPSTLWICHGEARRTGTTAQRSFGPGRAEGDAAISTTAKGLTSRTRHISPRRGAQRKWNRR
jgi:hypothetical protein